MRGKDHRRPTAESRGALGAVPRLVVGVVLAAAAVVVALAAIVVGVQVLSSASFGEAVLLVTAVIALTGGYWYLVWLCEAYGIGSMNEGRGVSTELDSDEWDEERWR